MSDSFFERPILNSQYGYPSRHCELDETGRPTQQILERRRPAQFITPIPLPKERRSAGAQDQIILDERKGLSTDDQKYFTTWAINKIRDQVDRWRLIPNRENWHVTFQTARLCDHWRSHKFSQYRPFFCQVEAVETAIWLTEVAPHQVIGKKFLEHIAAATKDAPACKESDVHFRQRG